MRASPRFSRLPSSPKSWAMARHSSTAWSGRTKTSMSEAIRSPSERPPPASTLNPTVPSSARAGHRPMSLISDPGAVLEAAGHRDLELAGQVGVLAVAGEEGRDGLGHRQGLDHLVGVDARRPGSEHTLRAESPQACRVVRPTSQNRCQIRGMSSMRSQCSWMVLAGGEVGVAVAEDRAVVGPLGEGLGGHPDLPDLGGREHARRAP